MKITRKQLKKLIEASVIKRGNDYIAPIEEPLTDPRDFDFDLSDQNKDKLLGLAGSDDAGTRAQADNLADTLGFPSSGRFGADTLSKQIRMYDAGLDLINDPEINQLIDLGVKNYFSDRRRDSFAIDLNDILKTGYKYPEGPGGFQLYLEGDPNWREKMPKDDRPGPILIDATVDEPHLHIDIINSIMDQIRFLIKIKFDATQSRDSNEFTYANIDLAKDFFEPGEVEVSRLGDKKQRITKLKKAYNLFKRRSQEERINFGPAIVQHIYDKAMQPMYEIFTSTIQKFNPSQDMSQVKEGKLKITRMKLRKLIEASIIKKGDYTIPVEEPIEDPLKDLDYDEDQKSKIKNLAMSGDEETRVQADFLADMGGFEDSDKRFGIDSFSDQVALTALDINKLLKDPDLYSLLDEATNYWVHMNQEDIVDFDTINNSSTYSEFARNVILDDPNEQKSDAHQLKPVIVDIALDKLTMTGLDKYSKMMDLFSTSGIAFVDNLIYDALELNGSLYELYKDWKQYYMSGERDIPEEELTPELKAKFANIKEGRK